MPRALACGTPAYAATGGAIIDRFQAWIMSRLDTALADRSHVASRLHTLVEGVIVMDAVGQAEIADLAVGAFSIR